MTILTWLAVSSLIWGAVIWGAGRLLQHTGDMSGRARQWLWRGATVLLLAPWVAAPMVAMLGWGLAPSDAAAPVSATTTLATLPIDKFTGEALLDLTGAPAPAQVELNLAQILLLVLAGGWIVRFVLAQYAGKSLLGIVAMSLPAEEGRATAALRAWTKRLGMKRAPRLRIVNEKVSPFSFGVFRSTICLPEGLEDQLSREALDLVIGHECLHVARGDGWCRPLERITADIMWFNPAAWLIRRELDVARELACDEGVVELSAARMAYARTLRDVAGFSAGLSHAAPAASMSLAGGRNLMLRVKRTLGSAKRKPARAAIIAAALVGLLGAPMAVAQAILVIPAPPVPPPPPALPHPPEAPAAAEIDTADGSVRAIFAGKITAVSGGAQGGFNVRLEGENKGSPCTAEMNGLGSISVAKGDAISEGGLIGKRRQDGHLRVNVNCADGLAGAQHSLTIPPDPPAPAAPIVEMAQLPVPKPAPVPSFMAAPSPPAPPSPVPALAPLASPAPPAPPVPMAPQATPLTPAPPSPPSPIVPMTPMSPVSPLAPVSLETLPAPQGISHQGHAQLIIVDRYNSVVVQNLSDQPVDARIAPTIGS